MRHLIIVTGHLTTKPRQQQCVDLIKKIKKSYPDIDILYATHDKNNPNEAAKRAQRAAQAEQRNFD